MVKFKVRYGYRGNRVSTISADSVVDAKEKFRKKHRNANIDSVQKVG